MIRYLKTAFIAAAALFASSCIHNDIPYPVVELRIANVAGEGFSISENNVTTRTITLSLDEATDIRNVQIDAVTYDAVIHSIQLDKEEVLQQIRSSRELTGSFDLRSPLYTTLSLYQDYEWTIRASQNIERRFSVTGQIGATEIEPKNRIARVYVSNDTDLEHIQVTELKLGPADITTYSPTLEELSGSSFETVRFVDVTYHGTVAALRRAYRYEGSRPDSRPVEQYGLGYRPRFGRRICRRGRPGIPHQRCCRMAADVGKQLRRRHPDGSARS